MGLWRVHVLVLVTLVTVCSAASAGLKWDTRELAVEAEPGASEVAAEFRFVNTGKGAVTITSIRTNCDCTAATSDRPSYQAGEGGHVTATVKLGADWQGTSKTKQVLVQTDDAAESTVLLSVKVSVPATQPATQPTTKPGIKD
jgi:hypothetical protein